VVLASKEVQEYAIDVFSTNQTSRFRLIRSRNLTFAASSLQVNSLVTVLTCEICNQVTVLNSLTWAVLATLTGSNPVIQDDNLTVRIWVLANKTLSVSMVYSQNGALVFLNNTDSVALAGATQSVNYFDSMLFGTQGSKIVTLASCPVGLEPLNLQCNPCQSGLWSLGVQSPCQKCSLQAQIVTNPWYSQLI
jgi:hypothetical protein